jgi:hypothetical protein
MIISAVIAAIVYNCAFSVLSLGLSGDLRAFARGDDLHARPRFREFWESVPVLNGFTAVGKFASGIFETGVFPDHYPVYYLVKIIVCVNTP